MKNAGSSNELVHVIFAQAHGCIVFAAHLDLGEDVFVARVVTVWITIEHHTVHLKIRDHFLDVFRHIQGMGLAGRFVDVASFCRGPFMLEVFPSSLQYESMNALRMTMP